LDFRLLNLIADLIVACEPPPNDGPGHPRRAIVRVVGTLRRFLREGLPWRSLRATVEQVSGSTLRRFLAYWAKNAVLAKVVTVTYPRIKGVALPASRWWRRREPCGSSLPRSAWSGSACAKSPPKNYRIKMLVLARSCNSIPDGMRHP
jgi:hypothetical protein